MHLTEAEARALAARAFLCAGVPQRYAADAAEILTLAEMMGIGTHGLARVQDYISRIDAGGIDPDALAVANAPAPALRHIDGRNALGPAVAYLALSSALEAARLTGMGAAFCRGASHLGALAPYLWIAAEAGFACIMTSSSAPMIAPAGGRAARVGNNPLGISMPHPDGKHVLLDMALSVASRSRVRAAARAGEAIPESWAVDAEGGPTTDPAAAMRGLMRAIGGEKGANLALCLDLMAGGLSGAATLTDIPNAGETPGAAQNLGQMILLIDVGRLVPPDELARRMDKAVRVITETPALDPAQPVRMPGSRAIQALHAARTDGFDVPQELFAELRELGA